MDKLLNYKELSQLLNISENTLHYWVHLKYIPHIKVGMGKAGIVRFVLSDVINWLNTRKVQGKKYILQGV